MRKITSLIAFVVIASFAIAQVQLTTDALEKRLSKTDGINVEVPQKHKKSLTKDEEVVWHVTFEEEEPVWTFGHDDALMEKSWHVTDQDDVAECWKTETGYYFFYLGYYSETGSYYDEVEDEYYADGKWAWVDIIGDHPAACGGLGQEPVNTWIQFDNIDLTGVDHPKLTFYQLFRPLNQVRSYIDFSTDGGENWTELRINSNIASNDYAVIEYEVYVGHYIANEPNASIRFRWETISVGAGGVVGYGWQIDDLKIIDNPQYDLQITDTRMNFFDYIDYTQEGAENYYHISSHYGQIPAVQFNSELAICWFNVAVENKGIETVVPKLNVKVIDPNDDIIFDETMDGPSMAISDTDTLDMIAPDFNFLLGPNPEVGLYLVAYEVFIEGITDENPEDNVDTAFFYVTDYTFGRDAKVPEDRIGRIGPTNWLLGGEDGDMLATDYLFLFEDEIKSVSVYIDRLTDIGTAFVAKLQQYDSAIEEWVDITTSTLITIEEDHLDRWVNVEFIDEANVNFEPGDAYRTIRVAIEIYYMGLEDFFIGTDRRNNYSAWSSYVYFSTEAQWYLARSVGPCIRVNMEDTYTINFVISDEDEEPIQSARVTIDGGDRVISNANGITSVILADGYYEFAVTAAGFDPHLADFTVAGEDKTIYITLYEETEDVEEYIVTFIVTDTDTGDFIEGATVNVDGQDPLTTDADGVATIELPDGNYTYSASAAGYYTLTGETFVVDGDDKTVNVELEELAEGIYTINFTVLDDREFTPIAGAVISIVDVDDLTTAADGTASVQLENGTYTYTVSAEGYFDSEPDTFVVEDDDKNITVHLEFDRSFVETSTLSNLNIYPNPTAGLLNIENVEGASIEIINLVGQSIYKIENANAMNTIDISVFPQGTYFIKIIDGEYVSTQKISLIY